MLKEVAAGVLVHESGFLQSNAVAVQGRASVLLIDPGITGHEMAAARCTAVIQDVLSNADWKDRVAAVLPPEYAEEIAMDLFCLITALPADAAQITWDGPKVRIIDHQAHVAGHAALLIEDRGVLAAGDMLSDILMPFLDLKAPNPTVDYLAAFSALHERGQQR